MAVIGGLYPHHPQNTVILKRYQRNQECFRNGHFWQCNITWICRGYDPILRKRFGVSA